MAQIQAKWPKSSQNLGIGGTNMGLNGDGWTPGQKILGFPGKIWAILLEFGPFCLDLGHIAWIWAI